MGSDMKACCPLHQKAESAHLATGSVHKRSLRRRWLSSGPLSKPLPLAIKKEARQLRGDLKLIPQQVTAHSEVDGQTLLALSWAKWQSASKDFSIRTAGPGRSAFGSSVAFVSVTWKLALGAGLWLADSFCLAPKQLLGEDGFEWEGAVHMNAETSSMHLWQKL